MSAREREEAGWAGAGLLRGARACEGKLAAAGLARDGSAVVALSFCFFDRTLFKFLFSKTDSKLA